ncbi:hypothetical protein [Candidatus Paracaedibacter symbiosus]|uniref:hypothetical protein n=1 Tax=Candidatus Paracaedibacter symbiosus TaxID=244582 RepID=UPI0018DB2BD8|nr:hypothetical protein [Candidatus Paracaedibacter symbiosus]
MEKFSYQPKLPDFLINIDEIPDDFFKKIAQNHPQKNFSKETWWLFALAHAQAH